MAKTLVKAVIIASISAAAAIIINQNASTIQAALTVPMTAWLLYQFSSPKKAWNSLSAFQNPVLFAINTFFAVFTYTSWKSIPFWNSFYLSLGAFLIGAATSFLIYNFWNIGA